MSSEWQQVRTYADHLGHRVVLEQYVTPDYKPGPDHIIPIQVYSLVPMENDPENIIYSLLKHLWT
ncbi:uncharacterized protein N7446_007808 [Penicillium canescens]|uniref:Uncharacterized protein n=1 Tax=Penicillium canescens TaxID=5083 RepID=A0AAD6IM54_PENCN|nr:uncharacterized protein N7446_007808 [Penicillium canescens]KAJ6033897.1 hypothetical protein N7444_011668 [Penicillium canescens]KAJ6056915.1 hypothetical protein N7460_000189 [Penicillium canescens]KAJ6058225.1 hypothetical protein N7446_007808 [Penicillium canescens]